MAAGDKYITQARQNLGNKQLLKLLCREDANGKPFLNNNSSSSQPEFIITIKTDNTGFTAIDKFKLPLMPGATYNALIEWGDGTTTIQTSDVKPTHTYPSPGTYQIKISGIFPSIAFGFGLSQNDPLKLLSIDNWGTIVWGNFDNAFRNCANMVANYSDIPNTSNVTNFNAAFGNCSLFNGVVNFDTSNAIELSAMFSGCSVFNQPVNFDTSKALGMSAMFSGCSVFNQPVNFDTSNVISIGGMFSGCSVFNQPVNFDTSKALDFSYMFEGCTLFNQSVNFDFSSVSGSTNFMFRNCINFNQSVNFDTSNVNEMAYMFENCTSFNYPVSSFLVSNVSGFDDFMLGKSFNDYNASYLDDIYNNWTNKILQTFCSISFGTIKRTAASTAARALLTRSSATRTVTSATNNGSGLIRIVTSATHGRTTGDKVFISGVLGCTEANGGWIVTVINTTTLDLQGSAFVNARTSGGTVRTGYGWTVTDGGI